MPLCDVPDLAGGEQKYRIDWAALRQPTNDRFSTGEFSALAARFADRSIFRDRRDKSGHEREKVGMRLSP